MQYKNKFQYGQKLSSNSEVISVLAHNKCVEFTTKPDANRLELKLE